MVLTAVNAKVAKKARFSLQERSAGCSYVGSMIGMAVDEGAGVWCVQYAQGSGVLG